MGKIYSTPKGIKPSPETHDFMVDGKFDFKGMVEAEKKWVDELRDWCKADSDGEYVGEVIREGVADGYAQYMVYSLKPLALIHLPLGDGYQFQWAHRWTASDIKMMIEREKKLEGLFTQHKGSKK